MIEYELLPGGASSPVRRVGRPSSPADRRGGGILMRGAHVPPRGQEAAFLTAKERDRRIRKEKLKLVLRQLLGEGAA